MPRKPTYEELERRNKELEKEVVNCKRIEEALQESEKRFKNVTNSIKELLVLLDQNLKVQNLMIDRRSLQISFSQILKRLFHHLHTNCPTSI